MLITPALFEKEGVKSLQAETTFFWQLKVIASYNRALPG